MHDYTTRLEWLGNQGDGTESYTSYGRDYRIAIAGKPDLHGSADPRFRGSPDAHNPEELFLAAVSACHMLTYLALCSRRGIEVIAYSDDARTSLILDARGGGRIERVILEPRITITRESDIVAAAALHEDAHRLCFIANSTSAEIETRPLVIAPHEVMS